MQAISLFNRESNNDQIMNFSVGDKFDQQKD